MEQQLLGACLASRSAWELVRATNTQDAVSTQGQIIIEALSEFYGLDEGAESADKDIILARLVRKHPKHEDTFRAILSKIANVSVRNIEQEIVDVALSRYNDRLSIAFAAGDYATADTLYDDFRVLRENGIQALTGSREELDGEVYNNFDIDKLIELTDSGAKLPLFPVEINDHVGGGFHRGQHVVIFGRPDAAKTSFLINMIHGQLESGYKVAMVENEDPGPIIYKRLLSRITGMTNEEIDHHPEDVKAFIDHEKYPIERFYLLATEYGTIPGINRFIDKYEPDVLIVDQLRNIRVKADTRVGELERIARSLRELGKKHNIGVVSTTQAGDSGEGKLVLDMGDVDWSNTGIQGACDLMIGIGVNDAYYNQGIRNLSFPKNKLNGNKASTRVRIDTRIARMW